MLKNTPGLGGKYNFIKLVPDLMLLLLTCRYKNCHKSNLNGWNYNSNSKSNGAKGINWFSYKGNYDMSFRATEMAIKIK